MRVVRNSTSGSRDWMATVSFPHPNPSPGGRGAGVRAALESIGLKLTALPPLSDYLAPPCPLHPANGLWPPRTMKTDLLPRKPGEIGGIACIRASSQYRTNFTERHVSFQLQYEAVATQHAASNSHINSGVPPGQTDCRHGHRRQTTQIRVHPVERLPSVGKRCIVIESAHTLVMPTIAALELPLVSVESKQPLFRRMPDANVSTRPI